MTTTYSTINGHPDMQELRARYEAVAETTQARALDGLVFLGGIWVAISPWVVGFSGTTPMAANDLIIGLVLALLALGYASAYGRTHNLAWVTPILGAWTIIAQWVVAGGGVATQGMIISNVITGGILTVLGFGVVLTPMLGTKPDAMGSMVGRQPQPR